MATLEFNIDQSTFVRNNAQWSVNFYARRNGLRTNLPSLGRFKQMFRSRPSLCFTRSPCLFTGRDDVPKRPRRSSTSAARKKPQKRWNNKIKSHTLLPHHPKFSQPSCDLQCIHEFRLVRPSPWQLISKQRLPTLAPSTHNIYERLITTNLTLPFPLIRYRTLILRLPTHAPYINTLHRIVPWSQTHRSRLPITWNSVMH